MVQDRYLKVVLTVIAVALSFIALTQFEAPADANPAELREEKTEFGELSPRGPVVGVKGVGHEEISREHAPGVASRAPTATLPLRWRVSRAFHDDSGPFCGTLVSVRNVTSTDVEVEIEWFDLDGSSLGLSSFTAFSGWVFEVATSATGGPQPPYSPAFITPTGVFHGYADVFADDPRILVTAFNYCVDNLTDENLVSLAEIPAQPVKSSLEVFRANNVGLSIHRGDDSNEVPGGGQEVTWRRARRRGGDTEPGEIKR